MAKPKAKFSEEQKKEICNLYLQGYTQDNLSEKFKCGWPRIREVLIKNNIRIKTIKERSLENSDKYHESRTLPYEKKFIVDYLDEPCHICTLKSRHGGPYAKVCVKGRYKSAHRYIFEKIYGSIPKESIVRHKCDQPLCININHLELGTAWDNVQDKIKRNRQPKGIEPPNKKITNSDLAWIQTISDNNFNLEYWATKTGISKHSIRTYRRVWFRPWRCNSCKGLVLNKNIKKIQINSSRSQKGRKFICEECSLSISLNLPIKVKPKAEIEKYLDNLCVTNKLYSRLLDSD